MQLKDKARSGRPREVDREAVLRAIEANPTLTTRMLAVDFDRVHGTIEKILHEVGKFFVDFRNILWILRLEMEKDPLGASPIDGCAETEAS